MDRSKVVTIYIFRSVNSFYPEWMCNDTRRLESFKWMDAYDGHLITRILVFYKTGSEILRRTDRLLKRKSRIHQVLSG
jgi:hypothetical protein